MIILDTNVVSELAKGNPNLTVLNWLIDNTDSVRLNSITVAEMSVGASLLPHGRRRRYIEQTNVEIFRTYRDLTISFDLAAGQIYGDVVAKKQASGTPISTEDAMIAAICLANSAALATRNTKDFEGLGIELINPWQE